MSADAYLVIRCDRPDPAESDGRCNTEGHWSVRVDTHRELRQLLKEERGWSRRRNARTGELEDLCPSCARKAGRARDGR